MKRLKHLPILSEYQTRVEYSGLELIAGDITERAEISLPGEAFVRGFQNGKLIYNTQISQHGTFRHHPMRNMAYVLGLVKETFKDTEYYNLAYMENSDPQSNKAVYTIRLVDIKDIIAYSKIMTAEDLLVK